MEREEENGGQKPLIFGLCEEFEGSLDRGADPMVTIDLVDRMGAKSMRIWMHNKRLLQRAAGSNEPQWKEDVFRRYRRYAEELTRRGIRIVAMNHSYLYPVGFEGDENSVCEMPEPSSEMYLETMRLIARSYEMLAAAFPEILYWECGNEVNMNAYLAKPGYGKSGCKNGEYDPQFCYTNKEKAEIAADICYYATLGVRRGNPAARVVAPAPTPYRGYAELCEFYEYMYRAIGSGAFPRGLAADTDPDNYFQVQCYHAYNFGGDAQIIREGAQQIVRVMRRHGDGDKKIFVTEFGYHDSDFVDNRGMTKEEADRTQAAFFPADFEAFRSCENIETVFVFRLYEWHDGPGMEKDFGIFTSPASEQGIVPKAKAKQLFRMFAGSGADIQTLYAYKRGDKNE